MKNSTKILGAFAILIVSAGVGAATVLGATTNGSHASRVTAYSSIEEMASDSSIVVTVTVNSAAPKEIIDKDGSGGGSNTVTSVTVVDQVAATTDQAWKAGDVLNVYQVTSAGVPLGGVSLKPGETYLLFLTSTALPDADARDYFPTGVWAGIYQRSADGTFRHVNPDGDQLPDSLTAKDLAAL